MKMTDGAHTIGNIGDFAQDVVSADRFVSLWWTDQGLTDDGDVDFGTHTSAVGLQEGRNQMVTGRIGCSDGMKPGEDI